MTSMICPTCGQTIPTSSLELCPYCSMPMAKQALSPAPFNPAEALSIAPFTETPADAGAEPLLSQVYPPDSPTGSINGSSSFWRRWFLARMPSRSHQLQGVIVSLRTQEGDAQYPNFLLSFLAQTGHMIREIVWSRSDLPNGPQKKTITLIRVRASNGSYRDVRMEGEPRGAMLAEGDHVSFWGRYHRGILTAHRGYNHTSEADIYLGLLGALPLLSLAILALVLVVFLVALSRLHISIFPHLP